MKAHTYYGACGVEHCLECRPIFDADNAEIPGTDSETIPDDALRRAVWAHIDGKFHDSP